MSDDIQRSNASNRLLGSYPAKVVNVEHPDGLYMASIRLLGLWDSLPSHVLPWAEFLLPIGAKPSNGHVLPVEVDDLVWVDFPRNGDTRYPRITGSLYHAPEYTSHLPDEVNDKPYEPKRADGEPTPPAYTRKDDLYDRFGLREHKTSSGGWSITHKGTGTALEITPEGKWVLHVEGDSFESATGKRKEQYDKDLEVIVKGKTSITSTGAVTVKTNADATVDAGGSMNLKSGAAFAIDAGAAMTIKAAGEFKVTATNAEFTLG